MEETPSEMSIFCLPGPIAILGVGGQREDKVFEVVPRRGILINCLPDTGHRGTTRKPNGFLVAPGPQKQDRVWEDRAAILPGEIAFLPYPEGVRPKGV